MTDFDKNIIDQFISFGFTLHGQEDTGAGIASEYKFYPSYLEDKHYTLVLFDYHRSSSVDHRLYIHNNSDGSYVDSLYQCGSSTEFGRSHIEEKNSKIFEAEIRIQTINEILQD